MDKDLRAVVTEFPWAFPSVEIAEAIVSLQKNLKVLETDSPIPIIGTVRLEATAENNWNPNFFKDIFGERPAHLQIPIVALKKSLAQLRLVLKRRAQAAEAKAGSILGTPMENFR